MKVKEWLKENMHVPVYQLIGKLNRKLNGYYRYYGITDNYSYLKKYLDIVKRHLFKVLNRLSQRKRYNWQEFNQLKKVYKLAKPKIYVNIFELRLDITYIL